MTSKDIPTGVVCDDRPAVRRAVTSLLTRCGILVLGETTHFRDLRELVVQAVPTVAVVTLPVAGMNGLTDVSSLHRAAPHTELVLVSAFGTLDSAARHAGALALVPEDDPQGLQAVLLGLSRQWHASMTALPAARCYCEPSRDIPASSLVTCATSSGSTSTNPSS